MNSQSTALLLIGFQNDYFAPDGILHSVIEESSKATKAVENTVQLLRSRLLKESRGNHAGSDRQLCSAIAHYGLLI